MVCYIILFINTLNIIQVAFGSDFQHDPFVRSLLGNKNLHDLMFNALDSVDKCLKNPLVVVCNCVLSKIY